MWISSPATFWNKSQKARGGKAAGLGLQTNWHWASDPMPVSFWGLKINERLLHGRYIVPYIGNGVPSILRNDFHDGAAHDGSVSQCGHAGRLFRRGDAEAHGTRDTRVFPDEADHAADVRGDLTADAGDA